MQVPVEPASVAASSVTMKAEDLSLFQKLMEKKSAQGRTAQESKVQQNADKTQASQKAGDLFSVFQKFAEKKKTRRLLPQGRKDTRLSKS